MDNTEFAAQYGPVALVTGASSGIGRSFAELLAHKGLDLVLVARRKDRLEKMASDFEQEHGIRVTVCQVDLSDPAGPQQVLDATGSLDIGLLISNAGFGVKGAHGDNDPDAMSEMLMVNCHAPMLLTRGFIPRLRARGKGGIVLTGSVEGMIGCPYSAAYSATKGFVKNLGEALWAELGPEGIDVLTLCPGATDTEAMVVAGVDPSTLQSLQQPEEVAQLTLENLKNGPVYIPSEHYRGLFGQLLEMHRGEALAVMAKRMKPG